MEVFKGMGKWGHEQVLFTREESVGYLGIIAIHDTTLGPALGGTRLWKYDSEEEAVIDVLRLSMGMTYKAAVAGLNLGGGKSVIIGDPEIPRREMIFRVLRLARKSNTASATIGPTPCTASRSSRDALMTASSVPKCWARSRAVWAPTSGIPSA